MFSRRGALAAGAAVAVLSGPAFAAGVKAPRVRLSLKQLPTPLPDPYNPRETSAQVKAGLDMAFERARAEDKRVIVDLGGKWCVWCLLLAGVMDLPQVRPFVDANFVVVSVFVPGSGLTRKNRKDLARFGLEDADGYPWLIVAEPDGTVLSSSSEVTDDDHQTPQAMVNWLAQWAKRAA